jgi:hypothetical protein
MPKDDSLSIILGRPFINIAWVVINCTESKWHSMSMGMSILFISQRRIRGMWQREQ